MMLQSGMNDNRGVTIGTQKSHSEDRGASCHLYCAETLTADMGSNNFQHRQPAVVSQQSGVLMIVKFVDQRYLCYGEVEPKMRA